MRSMRNFEFFYHYILNTTDEKLYNQNVNEDNESQVLIGVWAARDISCGAGITLIG